MLIVWNSLNVISGLSDDFTLSPFAKAEVPVALQSASGIMWVLRISLISPMRSSFEYRFWHIRQDVHLGHTWFFPPLSALYSKPVGKRPQKELSIVPAPLAGVLRSCRCSTSTELFLLFSFMIWLLRRFWFHSGASTNAAVCQTHVPVLLLEEPSPLNRNDSSTSGCRSHLHVSCPDLLSVAAPRTSSVQLSN